MTSESSTGNEAPLLCPQCHRLCSPFEASCVDCELDLTWLATVPAFRAILTRWAAGRDNRTGLVPGADIERAPNDGEIRLSTVSARVVEIGRRISERPRSDVITISDPRVCRRHCLIAHQSGWENRDCYWIVDNFSETGTFVNGRAVTACPLFSGDLLQVGPRAWVFNQSEGKLIPVSKIDGVQLELHGVGNGQRLRDVDLQVDVGQFVAVVGASGGGKSTLLRAVIAAPGGLDRGEVIVDGKDTKIEREWFRSVLGYVSQHNALHADLTAIQAVRFTAELRGVPSGPEVARTLRQVDLPQKSWGTLCRHLSGGESKRVRVAAELIANPRLFVLDEPGSGLDGERETIITRLLRCLSRRGCTILVVTHNPDQLKHFDRIVKVNRGQIVEDTSPSPPVRHEARNQSPENRISRNMHVQRALAGSWRQLCIFARRELAQIANAPLKRLVLPVLVVPILFAIALGAAVQVTDHHLLGLLAVLSCIWMGSSLALMSIVDEREAFDHERLLFLRAGPYVFAKLGVLGLLSMLQTIGFLLVLDVLRGATRADAMLYGLAWCAVCLTLVSLAAVGMGLVVSALAGASRPTANFILPLVMMFQIVFSVQVAGRGAAPLDQAYGEFHGHRCSKCPRRAQSWMPSREGWRCNKCRSLKEGERPPSIDAEQLAMHDAQLPNLWAARASYLTLSRYADIALRSFAYSKDDFDKFLGGTAGRGAKRPSPMEFAYGEWRTHAILSLTLAIVALPCAAILILRFPPLGTMGFGRSAGVTLRPRP